MGNCTKKQAPRNTNNTGQTNNQAVNQRQPTRQPTTGEGKNLAMEIHMQNQQKRQVQMSQQPSAQASTQLVTQQTTAVVPPKPEQKTIRPAYAYHISASSQSLVYFNCQTLKEDSVSLSLYNDAGIVSLDNGQMLIAGGADEQGNVQGNVFSFDLNNGKVVDYPELPNKQRGCRLLQVGNNIYAIAGFDNTTTQFSRNYFHMFNGRGWTGLPDMQISVRYPGVMHYNNCIYVIGGEEPIDKNYEALVERIQVYMINQKTWDFFSFNYPFPISHVGVFELNGVVVIFGGEDEGLEPSHKSFYLTDEGFKAGPELPGDDPVMKFNDPVCVYGEEKAYVYNSFGKLFQLDLKSYIWEEFVSQAEEVLDRV